MDDIERRLASVFAERARDLLSAPITPPPAHTLRRQVRRRQLAVTSVVLIVLTGIALGSFSGVHALTNGSPQPAVQPTRAARGGSITLGTRDYPECLNPITGCASNTGTWWTVLEHVLPRAMELDAKGDFVASPLLVEAPTLQNGDLTDNPLTITYHLDPKADWADGTPITSADFEFTWRAIKNTTDAYTNARYDLITSIDTTDAKTVVITLASPYADWGDLFGGAYGGLLEEAAFPSYANDPAPDLAKEMQTSIPFSGGPWVLKSFAYPGKIVLVPNDRYFGKRPLLDRVTMVGLTDMVGAGHALEAGIIDAFPWPGEEGFLDQFSGDQNVRAIAAAGFGGFEALWFNHDAPPLDDPKVREALMYAIDRQAMVEQVLRKIDPQAQVLNCGFLAQPGQGPWCQTEPFARFTYDPDKARQILESDGYDCSDLPCTKGGRNLVVDYSTVSTNDRRLEIQQLLVDRALPAGFDLNVKNYEAGTLFGDLGPHGQFMVADYEWGWNADPSVTSTLACESIPTKANDYTGGNWNHWCDQQATDLMHQSDGELDPDVRLQLMDKIYEIEARDYLSLPLYVLPNLAAWRTDRIAGPVGDFLGTPYGLFFNMNEWSEADR